LAVNLGVGNSTLTMEDGSVMTGGASAAGTGNVLNLNGTTKRLLADLGTTIKGFGATNLGAGANVEVTGNVSTPTAVTLGDGATLALDGTTAAGTTISLAGNKDVVDVNAPTFAGTLTNFGTDDVADLQKLAAGSVVSLVNGVLSVADGAGQLLSTLATTLPTTGLGLTLDQNGTGVTVSAGGTSTTITIGSGSTNTGGGGGNTTGGGTG
ncbi:hypothetical protein I3A86_24775, partial [Salmonella enterica]|nr:hypothetical protein [Salmonella enterica]